jgi:hypothetical protein
MGHYGSINRDAGRGTVHEDEIHTSRVKSVSTTTCTMRVGKGVRHGSAWKVAYSRGDSEVSWMSTLQVLAVYTGTHARVRLFQADTSTTC